MLCKTDGQNVDLSESKPITLLKMNPNWALIMFLYFLFDIFYIYILYIYYIYIMFNNVF